jgi:hypothetical protein
MDSLVLFAAQSAGWMETFVLVAVVLSFLGGLMKGRNGE